VSDFQALCNLLLKTASPPTKSKVVVGRIASNFGVIKYDTADGTEIWAVQHDAGGIEQPNAAAIDADGNIYLTGQSYTTDQNDFYTVKLNSNGVAQWTARYNGSGAFLFAHDVAYAIALDGNGDVLITGWSDPDCDESNFNKNITTIKHRASDGAQLWSTSFGSDAVGTFDVPHRLVPGGGTWQEDPGVQPGRRMKRSPCGCWIKPDGLPQRGQRGEEGDLRRRLHLAGLTARPTADVDFIEIRLSGAAAALLDAAGESSARSMRYGLHLSWDTVAEYPQGLPRGSSTSRRPALSGSGC
jgi:hypothetical protein